MADNWNLDLIINAKLSPSSKKNVETALAAAIREAFKKAGGDKTAFSGLAHSLVEAAKVLANHIGAGAKDLSDASTKLNNSAQNLSGVSKNVQRSATGVAAAHGLPPQREPVSTRPPPGATHPPREKDTSYEAMSSMRKEAEALDKLALSKRAEAQAATNAGQSKVAELAAQEATYYERQSKKIKSIREDLVASALVASSKAAKAAIAYGDSRGWPRASAGGGGATASGGRRPPGGGDEEPPGYSGPIGPPPGTRREDLLREEAAHRREQELRRQQASDERLRGSAAGVSREPPPGYEASFGGVEGVPEVARRSSQETAGDTRARIDSAFHEVGYSFQKLLDGIVKIVKKKGTIDTGSFMEAGSYRTLTKRAEGELSEQRTAGQKVATSPKEVQASLERAFERIQTSTTGRVEDLKNQIVAIAKVAERPEGDAAGEISSRMRQVNDLLKSADKGGIDIQGTKKDQTAFKNTIEHMVSNLFRQAAASMGREADDLKGKLASALTSGDEKAALAAGQAIVNNVHRTRELYDSMYHAGKNFDITLQQDARGAKGAPAVQIPESLFRGRGAPPIAEKTMADYPAAAAAVAVAKDVKGFPDAAKRARATVDVLIKNLDKGGQGFVKNMTAAIEVMKLISNTDLVDRREIQDITKVLDRYLKQVQNLKLTGQGLGAGKVVIPNIYSQIGQGGTEGEFLRRMDEAKKKIASDANIKRGTRIPIEFEIHDPSGGLRKIQVEYKKLGSTIDSVSHKAKLNSRVMSGREQFGLALRRVAMWGTAAGLSYGAISAFKSAISTMVDAELGVVSLSKVMSEADIDMAKFTERVTGFAAAIGVKYAASLRDAFEAMRIFGQQGKNLADTEKLTEATFLAANVSVLTQTEAAEALTATMKQFNMEAEKSTNIVDAWNEIANNNAVSMKTLADATKKAGSAASTVGIQFEQFLGLVTAVGEATRQPGKEIGTSLRFIFQRTLRPDAQKELAKVGVSTTDLGGQFKGFMPVISELADKWGNLTKAQQLATAQALGGARQYNVFLALMNNFDTALKASAEATNSAGSANRENAKYMETAAANMKKAKAAVEAMYVSLNSALLPVLNHASSGVISLAKGFEAIPTSIKVASVAVLGLATILARVASQLDYVVASGSSAAGGGILAGLSAAAGGLVGRKKSPEQMGPLLERANLSRGSRAGKQISDVGSNAAVEFASLGLVLQGTSEAFSKVGTEAGYVGKPVSKLTAVIRGMGETAKGSTETASLGISSLNSPLFMILALTLQVSKAMVAWLVRIPFYAARAITSMLGFRGTLLATASAATTARIKSLGWLGSFAALGAVVAGVYLLYKAISSTDKEKQKGGKETEQQLTSELALRQKGLALSNSELALYKQLSNRKKRLADFKSNQTPEKQTRDLAQGEYKSSLLEQLRYEDLKEKAGASITKTDPGAIEDIDKFGVVTLRSAESVDRLVRSAIELRSTLVALTKTKIAAGYGRDVKKTFEDLGKAVKDYKIILPGLKLDASVFGSYTTQTEAVAGLGNAVISAQSKFKESMSLLKLSISSFPKDTPIETFMSAISQPDILKAFSLEADKVSSKLEKLGKSGINAFGVLNKLFLQSKGFKGIEDTGEITAESYKKKGIKKRSFQQLEDDVSNGGKGFTGKELITFGPNGPFGLTQARVVLDEEGRAWVEGVSSFGKAVKERVEDVRAQISSDMDATIFDPSKMVQRFNQSILKAAKQLGGAGSGLIKFPAQLDLGVKFAFELGNIDKLQTAGKFVQDAISRTIIAQTDYAKSLEEFVKKAKANPLGKVATDMVNYYNEIGRAASQQTFLVSLMNEITLVGTAAEKAVYQMQKANIADVTELQFAKIGKLASGFSEKLAIKLPKLTSELSPTEKVAQQNPELTLALRESSRAIDIVKEQARANSVLTQLDIPKMLAESGPANKERFFDTSDQAKKAALLKSVGGDKGAAVIRAGQDKNTEAVNKGFKKSHEYLREIARPETKTRTETVDPSKKYPKEIRYATKALTDLMTSIRDKAAIESKPWPLRNELRAQQEDKAAQKKEALKRISEGKSAIEKGADGKLKVTQFDTVRFAHELVSKGKLSGVELKQEVVDNLLYGLGKISEAAPSEENQEIKTYGLFGNVFGVFSDKLGEYVTKGTKYLERNVFGRETWGKEFSPGAVAAQGKESEIRAALKIAMATPVSEYADALKAMSKAPIYSKLLSASKPGSSNEEIIAAANKAAASIIKDLGKQLKVMTDESAKQIIPMVELRQGIAKAAVAAQTFTDSLVKSLRGVVSFSKQLDLLGKLQAPIVGAGAGIPKGRVDVGKLKTELTPYERLFKKFPSEVGSLTKQEQVRQKLVGELPGLLTPLQAGMRTIRELSSSTTDPAQVGRYNRIIGTSRDMMDQVTSAVRRMNSSFAPVLKSFADMQHLEGVSKNIEAMVASLRKAQDLQFDTTSIDKALGRHPLAPTPGVFGQPADLNKFERQMFELKQKRDLGQIGGDQYDQERKKIDFNKEESVLQYKQQKENAKLSSEVDAGKKAMGLLWDAQYNGIEGLQPLISSLKSELASAGDVTTGGYLGREKEFRGVPGLQDMQKEIAKVQEARKARDFQQQRDIVMKGVEDLLGKILNQTEQQKKVIKEADSATGSEASIKTVLDKLKNFIANSHTVSEAAMSALAAIQKKFGDSGNGQKAADVMEKIANQFGDVFKDSTKSFKDGADVFKPAVDDFVKVIRKLVDSPDKNATKDTSKAVLSFIGKPAAEQESDLKKNRGGFIPSYVVGGPVRNVSYGGTINNSTQRFAVGGYITGTPGVDRIDADLPKGGFVISRPAVQKHGLSSLKRMAAGRERPNTKTVPAKVSSGEFVFGPDAVARIGSETLKSINSAAGSSSKASYSSDGTAKLAEGGFASRMFGISSPEELLRREAQELLSKKAMKDKMAKLSGLNLSSSSYSASQENKDLSGMTANQIAVLRGHAIAGAYREPQVGVTYKGDGTPKISKEATAAMFKNVDEASSIIDIGSLRPKKFKLTEANEAEVYGRVLTPQERAELKGRTRASFIRRKYEQYKANKGVTLKDLTKYASSLDLSSISKVDQERDYNLIKGLREGFTPEQYDQILARRKYIKEELDPRLDNKTALGRRTYDITGKQNRDRDSEDAAYDVIFKSQERKSRREAYVRDKFRTFKEVSRNSTPSEVEEFRRKTVNEVIDYDRGEYSSREARAKGNAELYRMVASLHTRYDKYGDAVNFIPGTSITQSESLQKASKNDKSSGFMVPWRGKVANAVEWKDPKTGEDFWVNKADIQKDGSHKEEIVKDERGNPVYLSLKVPIRKDKTFTATTGHEDSNEEGLSVVDPERMAKKILGAGYGKTHKGAVGVSSILDGGKDISQVGHAAKSKFEQAADFFGIGKDKTGIVSSVGRKYLGFSTAVGGAAEGVYGLGKMLATGKIGKFSEAIVGGLVKTGGSALASMGFREGDQYTGEADTSSLLYYLGGRKARENKGFTDKGAYELTDERIGEYLRDLTFAGAGTLVSSLSLGKRFLNYTASKSGTIERVLNKGKRIATTGSGPPVRSGFAGALTKQRHIFEPNVGTGLFERKTTGSINRGDYSSKVGLRSLDPKEVSSRFVEGKRKSAAAELDAQRKAAKAASVAEAKAAAAEAANIPVAGVTPEATLAASRELIKTNRPALTRDEFLNLPMEEQFNRLPMGPEKQAIIDLAGSSGGHFKWWQGHFGGRKRIRDKKAEYINSRITSPVLNTEDALDAFGLAGRQIDDLSSRELLILSKRAEDAVLRVDVLSNKKRGLLGLKNIIRRYDELKASMRMHEMTQNVLEQYPSGVVTKARVAASGVPGTSGAASRLGNRSLLNRSPNPAAIRRGAARAEGYGTARSSFGDRPSFNSPRNKNVSQRSQMESYRSHATTLINSSKVPKGRASLQLRKDVERMLASGLSDSKIRSIIETTPNSLIRASYPDVRAAIKKYRIPEKDASVFLKAAASGTDTKRLVGIIKKSADYRGWKGIQKSYNVDSSKVGASSSTEILSLPGMHAVKVPNTDFTSWARKAGADYLEKKYPKPTLAKFGYRSAPGKNAPPRALELFAEAQEKLKSALELHERGGSSVGFSGVTPPLRGPRSPAVDAGSPSVLPSAPVRRYSKAEYERFFENYSLNTQRRNFLDIARDGGISPEGVLEAFKKEGLKKRASLLVQNEKPTGFSKGKAQLKIKDPNKSISMAPPKTKPTTSRSVEEVASLKAHLIKKDRSKSAIRKGAARAEGFGSARGAFKEAPSFGMGIYFGNKKIQRRLPESYKKNMAPYISNKYRLPEYLRDVIKKDSSVDETWKKQIKLADAASQAYLEQQRIKIVRAPGEVVQGVPIRKPNTEIFDARWKAFVEKEDRIRKVDDIILGEYNYYDPPYKAILDVRRRVHPDVYGGIPGKTAARVPTGVGTDYKLEVLRRKPTKELPTKLGFVRTPGTSPGRGGSFLDKLPVRPKSFKVGSPAEKRYLKLQAYIKTLLGDIKGYKEGGPVSGIGGPTSDLVPAMLSAGEYVVPSKVVNKYGASAFDRLISGGGDVQKFASGGLVLDELLAARTSTNNSSVDSLMERRGKLTRPREELLGSAPAETPGGSGAAAVVGLLTTIAANTKELFTSLGPSIDKIAAPSKSPETGMPTSEFLDLKNRSAPGPSSEASSTLGDLAEQIGAAITKALQNAKVSIDSESASRLFADMPEQLSTALATALESVDIKTENISTAISKSLENAQVSISQDSISSVGDAVTRGMEAGSSSIANAISQAAPSAGRISGMGAAVRPEVVEALESRVEILDEKIRVSSDRLLTDINQRFSDITVEMNRVGQDLMPKINTNTEGVAKVENLALQLQGNVHRLMSDVLNRG